MTMIDTEQQTAFDFFEPPGHPEFGCSIHSTGAAIYARFDFDGSPSREWSEEPSEPKNQALAHEVFLRDPAAYAAGMYETMIESEEQDTAA